MKEIDISNLTENPHNPRIYGKEEIEKAARSIEQTPEMMSMRPILVDKNVVLAGNVRLRALKELGYKKVPSEWVVDISSLDEWKKQQILIKDNMSYGVWDLQKLQEEFEEFLQMIT